MDLQNRLPMRALCIVFREATTLRTFLTRMELKDTVSESHKIVISRKSAIAEGIVDKMVLFYAPKIMGTGGVPLAALPSSGFLNAPSLSRLTLHGLGRDFAVEGYFRDVYGHNGTHRED
jgi:hypothetical protein